MTPDLPVSVPRKDDEVECGCAYCGDRYPIGMLDEAGMCPRCSDGFLGCGGTA